MIERMPGGGIRKFTNIGGYPIFYVKLSEALCPECAAEDADGIDCAAVNWENESLYCDECSKDIECAYPSDAQEEEAS